MAGLILPNRVNYREPKEKFISIVRGVFGFDLTERISLIADVNHFKLKEDESVWEQAKGERPNFIEVYWDGVWICDFTDKESPALVRVRFLKGFAKAYEENKVGLNTPKELVDSEAQRIIDDEIKKLKNTKVKSQEDAISNEVQIDLLKEKKKPKGKKKKLSEFV